MSEFSNATGDSLRRAVNASPKLLARIDEICHAHEQAILGGAAAPLEVALAQAPELGEALFRELLLTEIDARRRAGMTCEHPTYFKRFPEHGDLVDEVFERLGQGRATTVGLGQREKSTADTDPFLMRGGHVTDDGGEDELPAIGGFELVEEIGRGGMGLVLKGRDAKLDRDVAVKVLLEKHRDRPELTHRFLKEARINGQLQHPGVVPVYALGQFADQRPYFAMKLVEGQTLAELLAERSDPAQDRPRFLKIFEQICQTLAYAHARGILHRDLKPHNVMVGAFGEVQVMDWGLAKEMRNAEFGMRNDSRESAPSSIPNSEFRTPHSGEVGGCEHTPYATQAGVGLGTVAYMPPEQARGESDNIAAASDVFGLGAILCEILTGQPPYAHGETAERYRQAQEADVVDTFSRLDRCGADIELISLTKRCLAADPAARPCDAGVLAGEVTAYLESVEARLRRAELDRAAAVVEAREQRRRRKLTLGLATAVVLFLATVGSGAMWLAAKRSETERNVFAALEDAQEWQEESDRILAEEETWLQSSAGQRARRRSESFEVAASALAALERARAKVSEAQSALEIGWAGDDLHHQVAGFRAEVVGAIEQLTREEKLFRDLDAARQQRMTWVQPAQFANTNSTPSANSMGGGDFDFEGSMRLYRKAFSAFGLVDPEQEGAILVPKITSQRKAVREALITALDDWSFASTNAGIEDSHCGQLLVDLAQQIDEHTWRKQVRVARRSNDQAQLQVAAEEALATVQSAVTLELLAYSLQEVGRRDAGVALLRRARLRYTEDFWINFTLGNMLIKGKATPALEREEAIGCYLAAIALRPETAAAAHNNLGLLLGYNQDPEGEIAAYARALEIDSRYAVAHTNLAIALTNMNDLDGAVAAYNRALEINPQYFEAHFNLGLVLGKKNELDNAIAAFNTALELKPRDARTHYNLGVVFDRKHDLDGAIAAYSRALEIDPRFVEARNNLGLALMDKNDVDGAVAAFNKALEIDPQLVEAHHNLGLALKAKGDLDGAIAAFSEALKINPRFKQAHVDLGVALYNKNDLDGAIEAFNKVLGVDPRDAAAHFNLGVALSANNDFEGAIATFNRALEINPQDANAHFRLGLALKQESDREGAIAAFNSALKINPRLAEAHNSLGIVFYDEGELDGAIAAFGRALEINPRHVNAHYNLGNALTRVGRFVEAAEARRRCLEELPVADSRRAGVSRLLNELEPLAALETKLPEVLSGTLRAANNRERLGLAEICRAKRRYATAARFVAEAYSDDPSIFEESAANRYNAACCAALAGCGEGIEKLTDEERVNLRRQTREWLRADLAALKQCLKDGGNDNKKMVVGIMQHWQRDPDLAGIRDEEQLAKLPAEEHQACRELWAEVDALLFQATAEMEPVEAE